MRVVAAIVAGALALGFVDAQDSDKEERRRARELRRNGRVSDDEGGKVASDPPTLLPTLYPSWIPSLGPEPIWFTPEPTTEAVNEKIKLADLPPKQRNALEKKVFVHFHDTFIDLGMKEEKVKQWIRNGEAAFDAISAACQKKLRTVAWKMTKKPWGPGIRDIKWAVGAIPEKCHQQMKKSVEIATIRRRLFRTQQYMPYPQQQDNGYQPQQRDNGYQPRQRDNGYQPQQQDNGYQPRQRDNGYQPRQRDNGYQPKQQDNGYQPRQRDNGYQPKQRDNGYQPKQGDYGRKQRDGGYGTKEESEDEDYGDEDYDDCVIEDEEDEKLCASVIAVCKEVEAEKKSYGEPEKKSYGEAQNNSYRKARGNPYARGEIESASSAGYSWIAVAAIVASLSGAVAAFAIQYAKAKESEEDVEASSALLAA